LVLVEIEEFGVEFANIFAKFLVKIIPKIPGSKICTRKKTFNRIFFLFSKRFEKNKLTLYAVGIHIFVKRLRKLKFADTRFFMSHLKPQKNPDENFKKCGLT
jgi:hypothetical protein